MRSKCGNWLACDSNLMGATLPNRLTTDQKAKRQHEAGVLHFRRRSTRHNRLARRLAALALGRIAALFGRLLIARLGRSLGLLALVPRVAAVAATGWQAGVLGEDLGGGFLGDLM